MYSDSTRTADDHRARANILRYIQALAVALVAMWLYRRALGFAYFNDDPTGHFAWMEGRSLLQFFTSSAEYGYYRPVVFAVLRLSEILFGNASFPHNPVADHALLWLLHGGNVALTWLLARRLSDSAAFAWATALIFASVPFNYEAVAYVASLTHPLLLFWLLVALLSFMDGRRVAAMLALILGLLTHENGLFILPALVGVDWMMRPHSPVSERARRLWPFAVPPLLFVVLWLAIPKNSDQGLNSLTDIARNTAPFLQTLIYPLLPALRFESSDTVWLALAAVTMMAMMGLLAWRMRTLRVWAYALMWFALSIVPALLFLGPAYVYGSPRLGYLPSVGMAMLWALPVLWLGRWASFGASGVHEGESYGLGRRLRLVIAGLVGGLFLLALALPPWPFIRCQLDFYDEASRFARGMAHAAGDAPAERGVVFVNAPFFFSSTAARPGGCPSPYPWTPVGAVLIPPYAQARDFVRFNGGPDRDVVGVTYAGYGPGWRTFGPEIDGRILRGLAAGEATYVFDLMRGSFDDLSAVWQPGSAMFGAPLATFGDRLSLYDIWSDVEADELVVKPRWRVDQAGEIPLAVFVHVYDAAGVLVAQSDGPPEFGLVPERLWQPLDILADEHRIDLSSLPNGSYRAAIGVYQTTDGARLAARAGGQTLDDDIFTIRLSDRP